MNSFQPTGYRPEIDGLRALAVLVVTFYHFNVEWFEGGYIGVDVFFVISGYLITGIILGEIADDIFTLRGFYKRRIRRIFPALFLVTLVAIPPALLLLVPRDLEDFGQSVVSIGFFFQNFLFHSEAGYFGGTSELKPLLHTWSLAVEEQFYLLFPFVCLLSVRYRINILGLFLGLLVVSLVYSEWQVRRDASTAFYLLPGRWWELMLGSVIAVLVGQNAKVRNCFDSMIVSNVVSIIGLGLILATLILFDQATQFPGLTALLPCLGTGLLIVGMQNNNVVQKFFALRPIVFLGLISYSLYLWHFPIAAFAKRLIGREFLFTEQIFLIALSLILAVLSWKFVEQPFRGAKSPITSRQLKWFAATCVLTVTSFGIYTDYANGAWGRFDKDVTAILKSFNYRDKACIGKDNCFLGDGEASYAVWGDSHADAILSPFRELSAEYKVNTQAFIYGGCLPFIGFQPGTSNFAEGCRQFNERTFETLINSNHKTIIMHGRWTVAVEQSKFKYERDQAMPVALYPKAYEELSSAEIVEQALNNTLQKLIDAGKQIVIIGPIPEAGWNVPYALAQRVRFGEWFDQKAANPTWQEFQIRNQTSLEILSSAVSRYEQVSLIEPHQVLCTVQAGCETEVNNVPLYADEHHLSPVGAGLLTDLLRPIYFPAKGE